MTTTYPQAPVIKARTDRYVSTEIKTEIINFVVLQGEINLPAIAQHLLDVEIGLTLNENEEIALEALYQLGLMTRLTDNEKAIMRGARDNEFSDVFDGGFPWVFAVIAKSGLDPKVARGSLASLVKKRVFDVDDYEGYHRADDMILGITDHGLAIAKCTKF